METYPSGKQYLAFPETKQCRDDLNAFARRRAGVRSWQMVTRFFLLLIKLALPKTKTKNTMEIGNSIIKFQFPQDANCWARFSYILSAQTRRKSEFYLTALSKMGGVSASALKLNGRV